MDTPEENKLLWRRFVEEVPNKRNFDFIDQAVDENVVFHMPMAPEPVRGGEALKEAIKGSLAMWSDVRVEIDELIAEGDRATALVTISGTMAGELMGRSVSGKQVTMQVAHFLRFSDGRIVEDRQVTDRLALFDQLGLVQIPQPA